MSNKNNNDKKSKETALGQVKPREIVEEMRESYIDYAMSVIVSRALPDVRDGLKPVHRRILYAMWEDGLTHSAKFKKSASVIGSVLAKYHPHGDMAVYDALVRMAQDFSLRYPLVEGQGNFGCFTKDTKVRLTDGRNLNFDELIKEQEEGKRHWTFTFNPHTKRIEIAEIKNPRLTRRNEKIMEVTLDNGEKIKCTLDHQFMLRDGSYKQAKDLKPGDLLMPLPKICLNKKPAFRADSSETTDSTDALELSSTIIIANQEALSSSFAGMNQKPWTAGESHPSASGRQLQSRDYPPPTADLLYYNHKVIATRVLKKRENVYDLTTEPWHNFALAAGIFVHNSIDGDSAAAYRYCITGDSLVITNRCLEKIGEVSTKEDIHLRVLSFGGKVNPASKWFDSGIHPTIKIETLRGYTLKGSFNHPILVLDQNFDNKPIFKWKLLSEVKKGDFAVIDRNNRALWPRKEPSLKRYYPRTKSRRFIIHKLPTQITPDLAFLMGAILAEGYISINKKKKYGKIGFCNTDKEFIDEFRSRFKKVFPDCPIYEKERNPLSYGKKKFISFEICSLHLVEFLENLGLKIASSEKKQIPHIIFHSTKESVAAFLRGFIEGDGRIYRYEHGRCPEISFISVSKKLLQEIQIVLLRFGIDSFLRFDRSRNNWILFLRGRDNFELFKVIGFVSRKNKDRLEEYCQINEDYKAMSKTDFIPFLSNYLRKKYKTKKIKWTFKDWLKRHNLDRYPKLRKYYPVLEQFLEKGDLELIDSFLAQHYLFDRIVSVRPNGKERVYSLRVDSDCHSFVSNGFVSHNTEAKLSKIGEEMLKDIQKNTVDFIDNFDGTRKEPTVLPSPLPQLLLNGSLGIAVGMATNIPPHNLSEVIDAAVFLADHPKASTEDLFKFIKGPDFPTGGSIYNQREIIEAYSQGKGPILVRGKAEVLEHKKSHRLQIVITEIPYQVLKSSLIEQIARLVQEKKLEGVKDVRDESDKEGLRIVIDLQKTAFPQKVLNRLYKFTDLQKTFHLNMLALVEGIQPRVLSLPDLLNYYLSHRKEVVFRRTKYDLEKAKERAHILEGLHKCLAKIDAVIKTIKNSANRQEAQKNLQKRFRLTEIQANAILETKLSALAKLERKKIEDELKEMRARIKEFTAILKSPQKVKEIVKKELREEKEKFSDERKTKVYTQKIGEIAEEDLIPQEETIITLTQGGYIKRINPSLYKKQKRGGRGMVGMKTLGEDIVEHFLTCQTHDYLLFFTDSGKVFRIPVYEIPEGQRVAKGRGLLNFLELSPQDKVLSLHAISKEDKDRGIKYLVMVTKNGIIKKTPLEDFDNVRKSGLIAISMRKGDVLRSVRKTTGDDDIILVTKKGRSICFKEKDIRPMGRPASGIRGIRLKKGDEVIAMDVTSEKCQPGKCYLLVVSENGFGKRTDLREYKLQGRGGSGIITARVTPRTGNLVSAMILTGEEEDLIVISRKGHVIRTKIGSISKLNRATQGVRIMKLEEGDKVASATCI